MPGASDRRNPREPLERGAADSGQGERPQRAGRRVNLPVPVTVKIGDGRARASRLRDLSPVGLFVEGTLDAAPGQPVIVMFDGHAGINDTFLLPGHVARVEEGAKPGLGIAIDRAAAPAEVLAQYRKLVLHFIRHRPLLDELHRGFFEGTCPDCGWIGRVGVRKPLCSHCGHPIEPPGPEPEV